MFSIESILSDVLPRFGIRPDGWSAVSLSSGLIHGTWKISALDSPESFIVQQVNTTVFRDPEAISKNISAVREHVAKVDETFLIVSPLATTDEMFTAAHGGHVYRVFPFVKDSIVLQVVDSVTAARAAAAAFGKLTRLLSGFDSSILHCSIEGFHDLLLRQQQFERALENGDPTRLEESQELISYLRAQRYIVDSYVDMLYDPQFRKRVMHHDCKISNVLFSAVEHNTALCVIDLDTLMPGYIISDIGDMIRTYCCTVSEEEPDFEKVLFRDDIFNAISEGYLSEMGDQLSEGEKETFIYAGKAMIYMQAIRFLTDHLMMDEYYGAKYSGHNFVRAGNQAALLKQLIKREPFLRENKISEVL
jgi:hypothetical protein